MEEKRTEYEDGKVDEAGTEESNGREHFAIAFDGIIEATWSCRWRGIGFINLYGEGEWHDPQFDERNLGRCSEAYGVGNADGRIRQRIGKRQPNSGTREVAR